MVSVCPSTIWRFHRKELILQGKNKRSYDNQCIYESSFFCTLLNKMNCQTCTLDNGLRVILLPSASKVAYCGYALAVGSRHEPPGMEGMAHFCEHITFKGTERRSAMQILNCLETVGGDLNAFTNKEHTVYYATVMRQHLARAIDLLTDIVFNSTYPQTEIDKEVEVICDEIESYNDSPAELIFDEFENVLFPNHPLGHNILGDAEQLHRFTTADALRFTHEHYRTENAVFFVAADVTLLEVVKMVNAKCGPRGCRGAGVRACENRLSAETNPAPSQSRTFAPTKTLVPPNKVIIRQRGTHQAHVMMGCKAFDMHDDRRIALFLLNNILGGPAMNSRLNLALRERRGLVYTVESSMVTYSDTGAWSTYFGCDAKDVKRCLHLVRRELDRLMEKSLTETQMRTAKGQLKGQLGIASDNRESFTLDVAKNFLHRGWEIDIDELFFRIDNLTALSMQQVACELFEPSRMTTLIYQ